MRLMNEEMRYRNANTFIRMYRRFLTESYNEFGESFNCSMGIINNELYLKLPYNVEEVFNKYIKNSTKQNGLSAMSKIDTKYIIKGDTVFYTNDSNKVYEDVRINFNALIEPYFIIESYLENLTDDNIFSNFAKGEVYGASLMFSEFFSNALLHDIRLKNNFINIFKSDKHSVKDISDDMTNKCKFIFDYIDRSNVIEALKYTGYTVAYIIDENNELVEVIGDSIAQGKICEREEKNYKFISSKSKYKYDEIVYLKNKGIITLIMLELPEDMYIEDLVKGCNDANIELVVKNYTKENTNKKIKEMKNKIYGIDLLNYFDIFYYL